MFAFIKRHLKTLCGNEKEQYKALRKLLGFTPNDISLYTLALTHRSASPLLPDGNRNHANNERLEFLGDAVLETIVSNYLFTELPDQTEGELTQMRSRIVNRTTLDEISKRMGIDRYLVKCENNNRTQKHVVGNALEALIGAIYLDRGYEFTNRFVLETILNRHVDLMNLMNTETDFKSRLIEWCQKSKRSIKFNTVQDSETMSNVPCFKSRIIIDGIELGLGTGNSKKEAEQKASWAVSQILGNDEIEDYFMNMIDSCMERYNAQEGKII